MIEVNQNRIEEVLRKSFSEYPFRYLFSIPVFGDVDREGFITEGYKTTSKMEQGEKTSVKEGKSPCELQELHMPELIREKLRDLSRSKNANCLEIWYPYDQEELSVMIDMKGYLYPDEVINALTS